MVYHQYKWSYHQFASHHSRIIQHSRPVGSLFYYSFLGCSIVHLTFEWIKVFHSQFRMMVWFRLNLRILVHSMFQSTFIFLFLPFCLVRYLAISIRFFYSLVYSIRVFLISVRPGMICDFGWLPRIPWDSIRSIYSHFACHSGPARFLAIFLAIFNRLNTFDSRIGSE